MLNRYWLLAKRVFSDWNEHESPRMGAALAFYSVLSLAPLLVLVVAIAGMLFDRSAVLQRLTGQAQDLLGSSGAQALNAALASAQKNSGKGISASVISFLLLLVGASGVFAELRSALNKIWDVKPNSNAGIWGMLRERIFSFGMVLAVGFLLMTSLVFSAMLAALSSYFGNLVSMPHLVAGIIDLVISLMGVAAVFALMFRYVPAADVGWREAWIGAALTSVLFALGKYLIGIYLSKAAVGSAYGAAGSIVVVIVWIYYTAQIIFFGAEFTHVIGSQTRGTASDKTSAEPSAAALPV